MSYQIQNIFAFQIGYCDKTKNVLGIKGPSLNRQDSVHIERRAKL